MRRLAGRTGARGLCALALPGTLALARAAQLLRDGGLVAFPTETVYGLGANALDAKAVSRIFEAKQRPSSDPLIVHVTSLSAMDELFDFSNSPVAKATCHMLASAFWPGPLTIIFKASPFVPALVTASTGWVGVRSPAHPLARLLLEQTALPIAAPSANRFGHVSPTTAQHVLDDLGAVDDLLVLEDDLATTGGCSIGIESTVLRVRPCGRRLEVLRAGAVSPASLLAAGQRAGLPIEVELLARGYLSQEVEPSPAVAPGQMTRHYSPDLPTHLISLSAAVPATTDPRYAVVLDFGGTLAHLRRRCLAYSDLSPSADASEGCAKLFAALRRAETTAGARAVLLPDLRPLLAAAVPQAQAGDPALAESEQQARLRALWERLLRAASASFVSCR